MTKSAYLELTTESPEDPQYTAVQSLSASDDELSELHIKITHGHLFQPLQLSTLKLSDAATVIFDVKVEDVPKVQTACILSGLQVFAEAKTGMDDRRILKASKGPSMVKSRALLNNMIDEDDLLQDEGDWAPDTTVKSKNLDDCAGREPCDNCTCGRGGGGGGEADGGNQNTPPATSNCGKCGMGDAFRCASCPFLGKPAFKPGQEHLVLDLQDDL